MLLRDSWIVALLVALPTGSAGEPAPAASGVASPPSRVVVAVYGAAGEVAGSMSVLDTGNARWMIDCGALAPERESEKDNLAGAAEPQAAAMHG